MVTPSAAGTSFDVLLKFSLDEAANKRVQSGVSTMEQELKHLQGVAAGVGEKYEESGETIKKTNKDISRSLQAEARVLTKEAAAIVNSFKQAQIGALRDVSNQIQGISKLALVGGVGILGGIFGFANKYVSDAEEATVVTREWEAATASLKKSQAQIGAVLAREALPLLRQAAELADRASGFVEKHPEIVASALNAGKILVTLGVAGTLLSKGIKLVADVKYLATIPAQLSAAKLQDMAADKQLAAARLRLKEIGGGAATAAKGASLLSLGPLAGILAGAAAYTAIGTKASQFGASLFGTTPQKFWEDLAAKVGITLPIIKDLTDLVSGLGDSAKSAGDKVEASITQLAGSENEKAIVGAFTQWKEDDARLISEAAENRKDIIADAEKAIASATAQYSKQRVDINKRYDASRADIIQSFGQAAIEAEANYAKSRAQIIRDAGTEIQRIEEQHQENIRKMTLDHNDRVADLTASRDALGLAKEARKFDQDLAESERGVNREIAQRRQDTARRLTELAAEYAAERAQKQAEFQQRLAENEANRQEDLKAAAVAHQEELKQIREQKAAQLRELQEGLNAERLRRREVFIAEIRDLDAALLGERGLKTRYYTLMLADAEKWLASYRAKLAGTTTGSQPISGITGIKDSGGYVNKGIYKMAWDNNKEFVMSGSATRAAERIVGGNLNQDILLRALQGIGGGRQATYVDQRRLERPMSKQERDLYKRMAIEAIKESYG